MMELKPVWFAPQVTANDAQLQRTPAQNAKQNFSCLAVETQPLVSLAVKAITNQQQMELIFAQYAQLLTVGNAPRLPVNLALQVTTLRVAVA